MRSRWFLGVAVVACALSFVAGRAFSGDPSEEEMAKWMALANPGPEHEALAKLAGEWNSEGKFWFGPGEPMQAKNLAKFTSVLGGRFVRQEISGEFMGGKFEGLGYTGYSNATKKYVGIWMDNHGTAWMTGEGTMDPATKTITFQTSMDGPKGKPHKAKWVQKLTSDKEFTFEQYSVGEGGEKKDLEIHYTRK